jgi:hypothetical protein
MSSICINPQYRDWIHLIAESSEEEIEALDFGEIGYAEMCESRLHWKCCPSCRAEFPSLPGIAERAGRGYEKMFAGDFSSFRRDFLATRDSLLGSGDDDAYVKVVAMLASAEFDIHDSLRRVLMVRQNLGRGSSIEFDPYGREILSQCRDFVASLEQDIQHFVIGSTLCFELLRPMWEKVGLHPRFDPRPQEEIEAEIAAELAGTGPRESLEDPLEDLRHAIAESCLEPKVLWEIIEAAARAHVGSREASESLSLLPPWIEKFEEDFDNFSDSMKATQMEAVRLSERNIRKAADYGPEIAERVGPQVYSRLHDGTKRQLEVAEFLYETNRQEPKYGHGPAINLALACENELNLRLTWPILKELVDSGTRYYRAEKKLGEKLQPPPLIDGNQIQEKQITLGPIGYYLGKHPDFNERARAHGFDPNAISRYALEVVALRDRAAHRPVCELADVDKVRSLILRSDGIFSLLHPDATSGPNP